MGEYITDISKKLDNIQVCGVNDNTDMLYSKIYIYNPHLDEPLHKFWFHIKNAKIVNNKSAEIVISNNENDTKVIEYIDSIVDKIKEHFKQNIIVNTSIEKTENYPSRMHINNTKTIYFDENEIETDSNKFVKGKSITCIIELSELLVNGNELWIKWNLLQVKILNDIDLKKPMFKPQSKPVILSVPTPPPIMIDYETPVIITKQNTQSVQQYDNTKRLVLSADLLKEQINKLKKKKADTPTKTEQSVEYKNVVLNKTTTKEPLTVHEIYKINKYEEMKNISIDKIDDSYIKNNKKMLKKKTDMLVSLNEKYKNIAKLFIK